ncbi:barstar family protein [Herpetosiphon llansteffanensis]
MKLLNLARDPAQSGLYRVQSAHIARLLMGVQQLNLQLIELDGREISSKPDLLHACAQALQFPAYVGQNWDALEEALNDLSWLDAQGLIIIFYEADQLRRHDHGAWQIFCEIAQSCVEQWRGQGQVWSIWFSGLEYSQPELIDLAEILNEPNLGE